MSRNIGEEPASPRATGHSPIPGLLPNPRVTPQPQCYSPTPSQCLVRTPGHGPGLTRPFGIQVRMFLVLRGHIRYPGSHLTTTQRVHVVSPAPPQDLASSLLVHTSR